MRIQRLSYALCFSRGLSWPVEETPFVELEDAIAIALSDGAEWGVHRHLELGLDGRESRGGLRLICESWAVIEELHRRNHEELENRANFELPLPLAVALLDELLELLFIQLVHKIANTEIPVVDLCLCRRHGTECHILYVRGGSEQMAELYLLANVDGEMLPVRPAVAAICFSCSCGSSCLQLLHPLKVVRIVDDARDDLARLIGERCVALGAVHLVAAAHLGNRRAAAGAGTTVLDDFGDRGD